MNLPEKVRLREVATRDGFQSLRNFVPTEDKLSLISSVGQAGVREIEATAFVSPSAIPQLADAAELMAQVPRNGQVYSAIVPNLKGAENAIRAGVDELVVVISATDAHNRRNVNRSVDQSLSDLSDIFSLAAEKSVPVIGAVAVAFGCPYQGDVPQKDLFRIADAYRSNGAKMLLLGDTTGMATPDRAERIVKGIGDRFGEMPCSFHFHNNRGTAMANLLAALTAGATVFDTALGGIGGCPNVPLAAGNLPTGDVVYMLEEMGVETGIDLAAIIGAERTLEDILGFTLPGQVMKSGPRDPDRAAGR